MKKLLITGGSGFVGGHLMIRAKKKWDVYATYKSHTFSLRGITPLFMNLEKKESIRSIITEVNPEAIIHCAAWSNVDGCEINHELAYRINMNATKVIAEECFNSGCRLLYISTDMVFDGENGNYSESDFPRPINVYGQSKLAGEEQVRNTCNDYVVARIALVYGPSVTGTNSFSEKIIKKIQRGETMNLFSDQYRTPILVYDLADALLELTENSFSGTIHLGGTVRVDRYKFGLRLAEIKGYSKDKFKPVLMSETDFVGPRPKDLSLNISRAKTLLSSDLLDYKEGLKEAYFK
jgi:dTDP-4-dehydrorhamnose reductase